MRGQIIGFGLANALMALLVVVVYPSFSRQLADFELPPALKAIVGDVSGYGTAAGFLSTEFFGWIPMLMITFAIIQGSGAIAGEEAAGTLDLLLAQPISRRRVILEKAAALALAVFVIAAVSLLGFALGRPFSDLGISWERIAFAVAGMVPVTLVHGTFALWMSALLPNRSAAGMAAAAMAVAGYFINTLGQVVREVDAVRLISPFKYYPSGRPLTGAMPWADLGLLLAVSAVFVVLAVWSFHRRDVSLGRREWSLRFGRRRMAVESSHIPASPERSQPTA
jgi:ABC-2 type transport system permease protein